MSSKAHSNQFGSLAIGSSQAFGSKNAPIPTTTFSLNALKLARADYLVTGNKRHFPDRWKKTKVISARELIELLMEQEG